MIHYATTYGLGSLDDPRADPPYRNSPLLPIQYPQAHDLQAREDWDEQKLLSLGEELIAKGMPNIPSNIEMHAYSQATMAAEIVADHVQTFIDNFETFLEELTKWQPPH